MTMAKRICQNCGAALPGGSLFCSRCGAPYSDPAAYCPVCGRTTESRDDACAVCGEPRKGASSDWKVPVIIMVCAILLAGAVLCFYFLGSGKKAPKKPSSQAAVTVTQTATPVIIGGSDPLKSELALLLRHSGIECVCAEKEVCDNAATLGAAEVIALN